VTVATVAVILCRRSNVHSIDSVSDIQHMKRSSGIISGLLINPAFFDKSVCKLIISCSSSLTFSLPTEEMSSASCLDTEDERRN
jgi:hypothetical protein